MRDRALATHHFRAKALAMGWVAAVRGIEGQGLLGKLPASESEILLARRALRELSRKAFVRTVIFRNDHHTAGSTVKAVNDPWSQLPADSREVTAMRQQAVHQRPAPNPSAGMDSEPRLFVENDKVWIFKKNVQTHGLGRYVDGLGRRHTDA
jgi:hypothetical protein